MQEDELQQYEHDLDEQEHVQDEEDDKCVICDGKSPTCPWYRLPIVRDEPLRDSQQERDNLCIICSDNSKDAVLLNCGHAEFCLQCAHQCMENINNNPEGPTCPMCRYPIAGVVQRKKPTTI